VTTETGHAANPAAGAGTDDAAAVDRLRRWILAEHPALGRLERVWPISGGRSNLVFGLECDTGARWCLRRPSVASTASRRGLGREYTLMSALGESQVPVPRTVGLCVDESVVGAPFFLMTLVEGRAYDTAAAQATLGVPARARASDELARALATIHSVDLTSVGLTGLARDEPYVLRQLRTWGDQLTPGTIRHDELLTLRDHLSSAFPGETQRRLLHGDFKIGNCLLDGDGTLRTVIDWELASLGDPRADLGWLLASWSGVGETAVRIVPPPGRERGFASRGELLDSYQQAIGAEAGIDELGYFEAFSEWKWACIDVGIHRRFSRPDHQSDTALDLDVVLGEIEARIERAAELLR
jgi:aminoglycoside phosphotransferase (APT) family kinase protein